MDKKKIVVVSHCVLNTAAKVVYYNRQNITEEEIARKKIARKAKAAIDHRSPFLRALEPIL